MQVLDTGATEVVLPPTVKVKRAVEYKTELPLKVVRDKEGTTLKLHSHRDYVDYVIDVVTKK